MARRKNGEAISVEYKEHQLTFNEETEEWSCPKLGTEPTKSLKAAKAAIDKMFLTERRIDAPALRVSEEWSAGERGRKLTEVMVTVLCAAEGWRDNKEPRECWIVTGKERTREKVYINSLYPLSERDRLNTYITAKQAAAIQMRSADTMLEKIKCHDGESLKALGKQKGAA